MTTQEMNSTLNEIERDVTGEWWNRCMSGIELYLYYKTGTPDKWGTLRVNDEDIPGFELADPRVWRGNLTKDQFGREVRRIMTRLPLLPH